jgi:hypothetical protein
MRSLITRRLLFMNENEIYFSHFLKTLIEQSKNNIPSELVTGVLVVVDVVVDGSE